MLERIGGVMSILFIINNSFEFTALVLLILFNSLKISLRIYQRLRKFTSQL